MSEELNKAKIFKLLSPYSLLATFKHLRNGRNNLPLFKVLTKHGFAD